MKNDWNELEFTNINDFKRMAPSIIQLEITRLAKIINSLQIGCAAYNFLVKARFDLTEFKNVVKHDPANGFDESKLAKLYSVLYCIASAAQNDLTLKTKTDYILDRLNDLLNKYKMLY